MESFGAAAFVSHGSAGSALKPDPPKVRSDTLSSKVSRSGVTFAEFLTGFGVEDDDPVPLGVQGVPDGDGVGAVGAEIVDYDFIVPGRFGYVYEGG
jgi:hypothetical protein